MPIGNANRTFARALVLLGLVGTVNLVLPMGLRLPGGGLLTLLAPTMLAAGVVLAQFSRPTPKAARPRATGRVVLTGVALMLVSIVPWIYGSLVLGPAMEQMWGMLGTITFILLGLPGLAIAVIGALKALRDRRARAVATALEEGPLN